MFRAPGYRLRYFDFKSTRQIQLIASNFQPYLLRRKLNSNSKNSFVNASYSHASVGSLLASGVAVVGAWLIYDNLYIAGQHEQDDIYRNEIKYAILSDPIELQNEARNQIISRDTISTRRAVLSIPKSKEITDILRENEAAYYIGRRNGVQRFDTCQVASNTPMEDAHSEKMLEAPRVTNLTARADWMFWGIYDGHRGWPTSAKLKQSLISYVFEELKSLFQSNNTDIPPQNIDQAVSRSFLQLDKEIVYDSVQQVMKTGSKSLAAQILSPAISGSCALLAFYDCDTKTLRTACAGDSRAILGRKLDSGLWKAIPLSVDQTGGNPEEAERIQAEHPNEEKAVSKGRILGTLEPSRSFGDGIYKWTVELQLKLQKSFFARSPNMNSKTPPYVTAEPVITTTSIEPGKEDFVVMASDSLWEMLTNEEVVGLVAEWKRKQQESKLQKTQLQKMWSYVWPSPSLPLPVEPPSGPANTWRIADRPGQWGLHRDPSQYVYTDSNAATHIARNAFGGNQEDLVASLLMLPTPNSRRYRDDLTITVIFFGEDPEMKQTLDGDS